MKSRKKEICYKIVWVVCMLIITVIIASLIQLNVVANEAETITVKAYAKVSSKLNVREEPNIKSRVIQKLEPGELVTTTLQNLKDEEWVEVQTDKGITGYVKSEYLRITFCDKNKYEVLSVAVITKTDGSSKNRNFNMKLAASFINGLILQPGEEFAWYSTNNSEGVVGPANKENGYKEATILVNKKPIIGYGGGVCQVSTALYNCIHKIDIEPTQHYHHSIASSYVKTGMDATVSYPNKNFVFNNTKNYPILFEAYTEDSQVIVVAYRVIEN